MSKPILRTGIALRCPACKAGELAESAGAVSCPNCSARFAADANGVIDLTVTLSHAENIQRKTYDETRAGHQQTSDPWHCFVSPTGLRHRRWLRRLKLTPGMTFLEAGCGSGALTDSISSNTGATGFAIDISPASIAGQLVRRGNRESFDVAVASALALPFADATFDAVVCTDLVEHLPDPAAFYDQAARVLKPGGQLLVRCNVLDFGLTLDWLRFQLHRKRWLARIAGSGHFYENFRTRKQHRAITAKAGLRMLSRQGFDIGWDNLLEYHILPVIYGLRRADGVEGDGSGGGTDAKANGIRLRTPMDLPHRAARTLSRLLFVALWPEHLLGKLGFGASEWMLLQRDGTTPRSAATGF